MHSITLAEWAHLSAVALHSSATGTKTTARFLVYFPSSKELSHLVSRCMYSRPTC
jgi:hypothetical protein